MSEFTARFTHATITPAFVNLWREIVERPSSYTAFKSMPMPEEFSPQELWQVFNMLRRHAGVTCAVKPWAYVDEDVSWFYIPKSVSDDQNTLAVLANDDAFLGTYLKQHAQTDYSLMTGVFDEVSALAKNDGINIEPVAVGRIWTGAQAPKTPEERVIRNLARAFNDMPRYRSRKISAMLFQDIHELLIEGVGELNLKRRRPYSPDIYRMDRVMSPEFAEEMVDAVVELARSGKRFRNPVLVCTEISGVFWDLEVFPSLNCLTEFLVRRLFFLQKELTALSFVRFTHFRRQQAGESGLLNRYEEEYRLIKEEVGTAQGLDVSLIYISNLEAYLQGARELEQIAQTSAARMEATTAKLKSLEDINPRQRRILMMALSRPGFSLQIQDFVKAFGVAYSTARGDLDALAQRGLMICQKKGRAFTYRINRVELKKLGI